MEEKNISLFEIPQSALDDLYINKFKLDTECESNGNLYHYYSDLLVDAEYERDLLKARIKEVESKIELQIRREKVEDVPKSEQIIPAEYKGIKLTESVVSSLVNSNVIVCEVRQALIIAERKVGKLSAVVKSFAQRKGELENLVTLYIGNYFSQPDTSKRNDINEDYKIQARNRLRERSKKRGDSEE